MIRRKSQMIRRKSQMIRRKSQTIRRKSQIVDMFLGQDVFRLKNALPNRTRYVKRFSEIYSKKILFFKWRFFPRETFWVAVTDAHRGR